MPDAAELDIRRKNVAENAMMERAISVVESAITELTARTGTTTGGEDQHRFQWKGRRALMPGPGRRTTSREGELQRMMRTSRAGWRHRQGFFHQGLRSIPQELSTRKDLTQVILIMEIGGKAGGSVAGARGASLIRETRKGRQT